MLKRYRWYRWFLRRIGYRTFVMKELRQVPDIAYAVRERTAGYIILLGQSKLQAEDFGPGWTEE